MLGVGVCVCVCADILFNNLEEVNSNRSVVFSFYITLRRLLTEPLLQREGGRWREGGGVRKGGREGEERGRGRTERMTMELG